MTRWLSWRRGIVPLLVLGIVLGGAGVGAAIYKGIKKSRRRAESQDLIPAQPFGSALDPHPLALAPVVQESIIRGLGRNGEAVELAYPVNLVSRGEDEFYVCNYKQIWLIELAKGRGRLVPPPAELQGPWVPTGLFYRAANKRLYVANYTGGNVLTLDASDKMRLKLVASITHREMKGPEGVAVSADGKHLAVADYDGNATFLFTTDGHAVWKYSAPTCHGVDILRSKDGRQYVLATSLGGTAVLKLDFAGRLVKKANTPSWGGGHGYMYPTAVMTRPDGLIAVTDAFRGQVSFLDEELGPFGALGANGPGPGYFNNPYGSCWAGPDRLLVADTFRDRLVEINLKTRTVTAIHYLADPTALNTFFPSCPAKDSEVESLVPRWSAMDLALVNGQPFGSNLIIHRKDENLVHRDATSRLELPLPRFAATTASKLGKVWHPGVQGLVPAARPDVNALALSMTGLFTDYPFRFLFGRNFELGGQTYLLLASPQSADVLVCGRGVTVPVALHKDMWLIGETLVGPRFALPARQVAERGAAKIGAFYEQVSAQAPLETIRLAVFPNLTREQFQKAFVAAMRSPNGLVFARDCWNAADAEGQRAAARCFMASCARPHMLQLSEILLAEMILCEKE